MHSNMEQNSWGGILNFSDRYELKEISIIQFQK